MLEDWTSHLSADSDSDMEEEGEDGSTSEPKKVYLPGGKLEEGEELVHDSSTYRMYHVVSVWA